MSNPKKAFNSPGVRHVFVLALVLLGASGCQPKPLTGRYLYVVACDGRVDKIDTTVQRKLVTVDLNANSGGQNPIPSITGAFDGCLTSQAVYDETASAFYTIAPVQLQPKPDGATDYRLLGFSIPSLKLIKNVSAGESLDEQPHLELSSAGVPTVVPASAWTPKTQLDLSAFTPANKPVPHQILESSGDSVLLRIFTADRNQLQFAIANLTAKTLVPLLDVSAAVAPGVHLAPGGAYALVEHTGSPGALTLYNAATGQPVKSFSAPMIKDLHFLAISPSGQAIFHSGDTYRFVDLGRAFSPNPVSRPVSTRYPGLFFAGR